MLTRKEPRRDYMETAQETWSFLQLHSSECLRVWLKRLSVHSKSILCGLAKLSLFCRQTFPARYAHHSKDGRVSINYSFHLFKWHSLCKALLNTKHISGLSSHCLKVKEVACEPRGPGFNPDSFFPKELSFHG